MKVIRGTVTHVDKELLYFCVDKSVKVYVGCLLSQRSGISLPTLGEAVHLEKIHSINQKEAYLCEKCKVIEPPTGSSDAELYYKHHRLVDLIRRYELGVADLMMINTNLNSLMLCFDSVTVWELILSAVEVILSAAPPGSLSSFSVCANKKFQSPFALNPISTCRYVDIRTNKYSSFPYWSHGVHPQTKPHQNIIGYLYFHPDYGVPMLKDSTHQMLCVITCTNSHTLKKYLESYVVFGKCFVITEIYRDKSVPNLEYILVDLKEIFLLKQVVNCYKQMGDSFEESDGSLKYQHNMVFLLENKSVIKYSKQNETECWLHIRVSECSNEYMQKDTYAFLRLTLGNLKWIPLLNCESMYKVFYNGSFKEVFDTELKRMSPAQRSFELSKDALFCLQEYKDPKQLMDVATCKAYITTEPQDVVSFKGKLKVKKFVNPLSSRTERRIALYGFGTPGVKTHYLEFEVEGDPVKTFKVYLNNWESCLIPCGLIPNMVVAVRNVAQQKGKYCKSTPLTSFQVLAYDPPIIFNTASLYSVVSSYLYGEPFFFGLGKHIPCGVLIYGECLTIQIRSVKINNGRVGKGVELSMILTIQDQFGQARVISRCEDMLQMFLGLNTNEYASWCDEFRKSRGSYEYDINSAGGAVMDPLHDMMTCVFNMINAVGLYSLKMCCRKLNSRADMDRGMSLWYCVSICKPDIDHLIVADDCNQMKQYVVDDVQSVLDAIFDDVTI